MSFRLPKSPTEKQLESSEPKDVSGGPNKVNTSSEKYLFPSATYSNEKDIVQSKGLPSKIELKEAQSKPESRVRAYHYMSMNAYSKHKKLCNDYIRYYSGGKSLSEVFQRDKSKDKNDLDVIREEIRFVYDEDDDVNDSWEKRLAKKYYDKLFKEYCICDLTLYEKNKIAMRWRIEKEVILGKGQFICGSKRCDARDGLRSWEVNFGYVEHSEKKNALVKLRLCPECSLKLNFHHQKKEVVKVSKSKHKKRSQKRNQKTEKPVESSSASSSTSDSENETVKRPIDSSITEDSNKKQKIEDEKAKREPETTKEGNMIVLGSSSEMWKCNPEKASGVDEVHSREEDFESYLEDLLL